MAYLSLDNAQVLHVAGLPAANSQTKFRVELSDDATLSLFRRGLFGEQRAFFASLGMMALRTWTDVVQSGGGFIGGGFGFAGAAEGMLVASALNALTTKRSAYALLGIFIFPLDGSKRELPVRQPSLRMVHGRP